MLVLGLDFETQCSDAKTTRFTEIGAALYEVKNSMWKEVDAYNALAYEPDYPPQTEKIVELTGITDEMLKNYGKSRAQILTEFFPLVMQADIIMAHKVSFDKTVLVQSALACGMLLPRKEWLCTLTNFNWPKNLTCHKLSHLAYEHGIMVDPRTLHRATDDVRLMIRLVAEKYNWEEVLSYARQPWVYLQAEVLGPWQDGGVQNEIAKSLGFAWEQVKGVDEYKFTKKWVTRVKQGTENKIFEAVRESKSPFRVTQIVGLS